uniref:Uncharacterized protein n=1 Tax=Varanus komodoensis TaxID=61221 RepID=A0A8D2J699_VARKO
MPEGPSVKKFQILCAPFVGQTVTKVGGSTRQVNPDDLKMLTLWDAQVSPSGFGLPDILLLGRPSSAGLASKQRNSQ